MPLPKGVTLTPAERAGHLEQVAALHKAGLGRNAIARETGLGLATVTAMAGELGLSFDRSTTEAATSARKADLAARRLDITDRLYARVEKLLDKLDGEEWRTLVAVAPGVDKPQNLDFVPPADEKATASSIGSYLAAAAKIEAVDSDRGLDAAKSLLTDLGTAFGLIPDAG